MSVRVDRQKAAVPTGEPRITRPCEQRGISRMAGGRSVGEMQFCGSRMEHLESRRCRLSSEKRACLAVLIASAAWARFTTMTMSSRQWL